ncbi:MAG: bifunctional phosphoserine phosphatase/homoserine phosphotransferase ThrH [Opitutales bacterium]|jgi:phosphoserine/homoserine phosphotransferase
MHLVCLDLEGVLVPEIWIAVAEKTGHPELRRTTRDEPDYDKLMRYRLELLDRHGITLPAIQEVIGSLRPLDGAREFLDWLRTRSQLIILSDTFEQFAQPLLRQLGWPTLLCHELVAAPAGRITGYRLRQPDQKRRAVAAFRSLNYEVIAAGDSHNDLAMLQAAHHGILFRPTDAFAAANPHFPVTRDYPALRAAIERILQ